MKTDEAYIKLAEKNRKPDSKILHEILKLAMIPEEAAFIVELPASNADLAAKFHTDEKAIEEKIHGLARRGLVVRSRKGYRYPGDLGTLHDNILASDSKYIPPGMGKLWMDLYEEGWWKDVAGAVTMLETPALRAILPLKTAPPNVKLLPYEDIEQIIKAHKDLISVRNCCCRVGNQAMPNSQCRHPIYACTQFGGRAEYDLFREGGRKVSVDEAISISMMATKSGLVPTVTNMSLMEALEFICYCCGDACMVLAPTIRARSVRKALAPTRFLVKVDNDLCNGCQDCLPVCYFDAIKMKKLPGFDTPKAVISTKNCIGCGLCMLRCAPAAMSMELVRPPEFIPETIAGPAAIVHASPTPGTK
jgi:ferredoxin